MKHRHLLSALLALVMLVSVLQPAFAATQPNIIWGSWVVVKRPTCTQEGTRMRRSNIEGLTRTESIPATGHQFGELTVTREATCQTRARAERTCKVCGHTEWTYVGELGPHKWSEWTNVDLADGTPLIKRQRTCEVCGKVEEEEIDLPVLPDKAQDKPTISLTYELINTPFYNGSAGAFRFTVKNTSTETLYFLSTSVTEFEAEGSYAVLEPNASFSGINSWQISEREVLKAKENGGIAKFGTFEVRYRNDDGQIASAEVYIEYPIELNGHPLISLEGSLDEPGPFAPGEKVSISVTVKNECDLTLYFSHTSQKLDRDFPAVLAPNQSETIPYTFIVTEEMVNKYSSGSFSILFSANYKIKPGQVTDGRDVAYDAIRVSIPLKNNPPAYPSILLSAALDSDGPFAAGETVTVTLTLKNESKKSLIFDTSNCTPETPWPTPLDPHTTIVRKVKHTITEEMADLAKNYDYLQHFSYYVCYQDYDGHPSGDSASIDIPLAEKGPVVSPEAISKPVISMTSQLESPGPFGVDDTAVVLLSVKNECDQQLTYNFSNYAPEGGWPATLAPNAASGEGKLEIKITQSMVDSAPKYGDKRHYNFGVTYVNENGDEAHAEAPLDIPIKQSEVKNQLALSVYIPGGSQEPYVEDDGILFHATVTNTGNSALHDVRIFDPFTGKSLGHVDLAPGKPHSEDILYYVADTDVGGTISPVFDAVGLAEDNSEVWAEAVSFDLSTEDPDGHDPHLSLGVSGGDAENLVQGSVVKLDVTVYNDGKEPVDVTSFIVEPADERSAYDQYSSWYSGIGGTIDVGAEPSFTYSLVVSPKDIELGSIHRDFTVAYVWTSEDGAETTFLTNTVPVDLPIADGENHAELTLSCISNPSPGAKIGDKVSAMFILTNTGNVPVILQDIQLQDYPGRSTDPNAEDDMSQWAPYIGIKLESFASISVYQYTTVIASDMGAGKVFRQQYANGVADDGTKAAKPVASNMASMTVALTTSEEDAEPFTVVKSRIGDPLDSHGYQVGEAIHYQVVVTNVSDMTIGGLVLLDPIFKEYESPVIDTRPSLAPGESWTVPFTYYVTDDDLINGNVHYSVKEDGNYAENIIYNRASLIYTDPEGGEDGWIDSNIVEAPLYQAVAAKNEISLIKECTNQPNNKVFYTPGEKITYTITICNDTNETLNNVVLTDPLLSGTYPGGVVATFPSIAPGETKQVDVEYTVTEEDADAAHGYVTNYALMTVLGSKQSFELESNKVTRRTGVMEEEVTVGIIKIETSFPAIGGKYRLGEWINYELQVKNLSKETLSEVVLSDTLKLEDGGVLVTVHDLAPDDGFTWTFSHQVTEQDIIDKEVVNYGVVDFTWGEGFGGHVVSEPVRSPTGSGGEEDCCQRILTQLGDGSVQYRLVVCEQHQSAVNILNSLLDDAAGDDELLNAYRLANEQWAKEIDALYTELQEKLPEETRYTVTGSRMAWQRYITASENALRDSMKLSEPEIAEQLYSELMLRCIDLCYALNHAPDAHRPDSIVTGSYTVASAHKLSDECVISIFADEDGTLRMGELICEDHAATQQLLLAAISSDDTAEALAADFNGIRMNWVSALNSQISRLTIGAAQEIRRPLLSFAAQAETLLIQDAELYMALYPDNPEIAAEIVCREAQETTAIFCRK